MAQKKKWEDEVWVDLQGDDLAPDNRIKISNYGRAKSFKVNKTKGRMLKLAKIGNYNSITVRRKNGKGIAKYIHRLVAEHFLEKPSPEHIHVIHLDYNKRNNYYKNLKWVTKDEREAHYRNHPNFGTKKMRMRNSKLTLEQVKNLRKEIFDPNRTRTYREIARKYRISEMQLYRIKAGKNWSFLVEEEKQANK